MPPDVLVGQQVGAVHLEEVRCAVLVHQGELQDLRLLASEGGRVGEQLPDAVAVGGIEQLVEATPDHSVGIEPEQPLDRRALVADRAVGTDDGDEVACMADQRAEARLAAAAVDLLGRAPSRCSKLARAPTKAITSSSVERTVGGKWSLTIVRVQYMRTATTDIPRTLCEKAARTGDVVERSTGSIGLPSPQRSAFPRYTCDSVSRETVRPVIREFTMTLNESAAPAGRGPASAMRTRWRQVCSS